MQVSIVVAASTNDVIGVDGDLPWRLPDDLKRFKQLTVGKPIVMGRLTWESIGKPLPDRQNIVISRDPDFEAEGCHVVGSPELALALAGDADEIMVIGGGHIYRAFLPLADRIYLTRVDAEIEGDAKFPELDMDEWHLIASETHAADERHDHAYTMLQLERHAPD
jgi:dihydrofolate reductase